MFRLLELDSSQALIARNPLLSLLAFRKLAFRIDRGNFRMRFAGVVVSNAR
jgi:hypothetical protein